MRYDDKWQRSELQCQIYHLVDVKIRAAALTYCSTRFWRKVLPYAHNLTGDDGACCPTVGALAYVIQD